MILGKVIGSDRQYRIDGIVAKGAFSTVYRCVYLRTGCQYAIKVISKDVVRRYKMKKALIREVNAMELAGRSSYVVKLVDKMVSENNYYIIMALAEGGTLLDLIRERRSRAIFPGGKSLCKQLLIGVATLHDCDIVHRDIKPENILLDKDKTKIMITDFGFSCYSPLGTVLRRECGTLKYCAPELLVEKPSYDGRKVDVWAAGITMYLVIFGVHPYPSKERDPDVLLELITKKTLTFPSQTSPELKDLLSKMLEKDPAKRWSAADLLNHPWMSDVTVENHSEDQAQSIAHYSISHDAPTSTVARSPLLELAADMLDTVDSFGSDDNVDDGFYSLSKKEEMRESFAMEDSTDGDVNSSTASMTSKNTLSLSSVGTASMQSKPGGRNSVASSPFIVDQPPVQKLNVASSEMSYRSLLLEIKELVFFFIFWAVLIVTIFIDVFFTFFSYKFFLTRKLSRTLAILIRNLLKIFAPRRDAINSNFLYANLNDNTRYVEIPTAGAGEAVAVSRASNHLAKVANLATRTLRKLLPICRDGMLHDLGLFINEDTNSIHVREEHNWSDSLRNSDTDPMIDCDALRVGSPLAPLSNIDEKHFMAHHKRLRLLDQGYLGNNNPYVREK